MCIDEREDRERRIREEEMESRRQNVRRENVVCVKESSVERRER